MAKTPDTKSPETQDLKPPSEKEIDPLIEALKKELTEKAEKLEAAHKELDGLYKARDEALNTVTSLETANAKLVLKTKALKELTEKAEKLEIGQSIVLDENDETEVVVLHRKRSPKPTGKFVPKCHYRFAVPAADEEVLAQLAREGAVIAGGADNTKVVSLRPHMKELGKGERLPSYSVPAEAAEHGVVSGALDEEVR